MLWNILDGNHDVQSVLVYTYFDGCYMKLPTQMRSQADVYFVTYHPADIAGSLSNSK